MWKKRSNISKLLRRKGALLGPTDQKFFEAIHQCIADVAWVFPLIPLIDLTIPSRGESDPEWREWIGEASGFRLDLVVCRRSDFSIVCAILLNTSEYSDDDLSKLTENCRMANIPVIEVADPSVSNLSEICKRLLSLIDVKASDVSSLDDSGRREPTIGSLDLSDLEP